MSRTRELSATWMGCTIRCNWYHEDGSYETPPIDDYDDLSVDDVPAELSEFLVYHHEDAMIEKLRGLS